MLVSSGLVKIEDIDYLESNDLDTLLNKILNYLKHITHCDAGSIYLKDGNDLTFHIFQNNSFSQMTIDNIQIPLKKMKFEIKKDSNTIAVESFITKKIITIDDIYKNNDFDFKSSKEFDIKFNYKTKSILTAPLINFYSGESIGVLQLINKQSGNNLTSFTNEDKDFISLSSYLIALSIITTKQSQETLRKINKNIEKQIISRTKSLEDIQHQLLEQVNKDPMTELFNRRYFNEINENLLSITKKSNSDMSIIMLDVDNFKTINDTYGHSVGDIVICNISDILKKSTRTSDICVRFGGEEFVVVLPKTSLENSVKIAEKIRKTIENAQTLIEQNEVIKYTVSVGVSKIEALDNSIVTALNRADTLLYEAKSLGKNLVRF